MRFADAPLNLPAEGDYTADTEYFLQKSGSKIKGVLPKAVILTLPRDRSLDCYADTNGAIGSGEAFITRALSVSGLVARADFSIALDTCDKDGDNMFDCWEARHGLSWTNAADAASDPDGDGLYNLHEYWAMNDPWTADTNANYAVTDAMRAVDTRIAGLNPTNAIRIFLLFSGQPVLLTVFSGNAWGTPVTIFKGDIN